MTAKDKQLLLKDLCARLPYGVKLGFENSNTILTPKEYCCFTQQLFTNLIFPEHNGTVEYGCQFYEYRPYLRPMSSMTKEEKDELCKLCDFKQLYDDRDYFTHYGIEIISEYCINGEKIPESIINYNVIDFFHEHHLDWRGLIPKGLALEAPEGMYKTE